MKKKIIIFAAVISVIAALAAGAFMIEKNNFFNRASESGTTLPENVTKVNQEGILTELTVRGTRYAYSPETKTLTVNGEKANGYVGENVDYWHENVKKIVASVEILYSDLFYNFSSLEEIIIEEGCSTLCAVNGVLYNKDMTELLYYPPMKPDESFEVPSTVTRISQLGGKRLKNLIISDSVKIIDRQAFSLCESLESVSIGKGFEKFEFFDAMNIESENKNPFERCDNLKNITVDEKNKFFKNDSYGALYTHDMKYLLTVPANAGIKEYTVPDSVVELSYCFTNCAEIEVINIGSGVL